MGKVLENTNIPKLRVSDIFYVKQKFMQFPDDGMSEFPYYGTSMRKHRQFPGSALPYRFGVSGNPCNPWCLEKCEFPYHGNILWKANSFLGCGFLRKLEVIRKTKESPEH